MKKEVDDSTIKNIRNLFRLKKENESIRYTIIRDVRNLFEYEEEDYYKPVRVSYIEYESHGDKNKTLSVKKYLNKIRPYLKDVISNLKKSDTWKIQLTIAINFISSKDNDEEHVIHSKSDNKEIKINVKADEVIEKHFKSLLNRYQNNFETSARGSDFIFDCILYCVINVIK